MSCSNCGWQLIAYHLDNQTVFHCRNCGGTFFEQNGINRVSLRSSLKLAYDRKTEEVASGLKRCPRDGYRMLVIMNDEAVPTQATLLRCPSCQGIFAYPDDLVAFKKAQREKVGFYQMWQSPASSMRAVIVLTFILVVSAGVYFTFNASQQSTSRRLEASDIISEVDIRSSGRFLFITFKTNAPFRSKVVFRDLTTGKELVKEAADKLSTIHTLSITELNLSNEIVYQILLYPKEGGVIETPQRNLVIDN